VFWPKLPKTFADEWFKLGYAYHVQGELAPAEHAYLRALKIDPNKIWLS
jgi:cytochrome c-type biogenesis protein CcmH/NrfG